VSDSDLTRRERRIARRLDARGDGPLFRRLHQLCGVRMRERFELGELLAVGGEGAIYRVRDRGNPESRLLGKVPLVKWHRPIKITSRVLRAARAVIEHEARVLTVVGCPYLPQCEGLQQFDNPLLESERGGEFGKPEPVLVMEYLAGQDLDTWLCRVHRGRVDLRALRATLDRLVVGTLQALSDLEQRGWVYADLRPGNLRVMGRPRRRIRLIDAGGVVQPNPNVAHRFPHVPSYLPPDVFWAADKGRPIVATAALHAAMAGRALYEIATGEAPQAAKEIDHDRLAAAPVSTPVAETIAALARGGHSGCHAALQQLAARADRRIRGASALPPTVR